MIYHSVEYKNIKKTSKSLHLHFLILWYFIPDLYFARTKTKLKPKTSYQSLINGVIKFSLTLQKVFQISDLFQIARGQMVINHYGIFRIFHSQFVYQDDHVQGDGKYLGIIKINSKTF